MNMEAPTTNSNAAGGTGENPSGRRRFPFGWRRLIGLGLIVAGLFLSGTFIQPYLYYAFAPIPSEGDRPLKKTDNRIFIPSIKLNARLFGDTAADNDGIVLPYGANLGRKRNTVLEGHNLARRGGPLFTLLYLVRADDEIILHYQGKRYVYVVEERRIVEPILRAKFIKEGHENRLTLITCYPPTRTFMRLIVIAKPKSVRRPG